MDLSKIKLVVTDLDGTLLNSKQEVSAQFTELFNQLLAHNIVFVAASGRPQYSIIKKLHTIKNDITIVSDNGALVSKNNDVILSSPLKRTKLAQVIRLINALKHTHPVYCGKNKAFVNSDSKNLIALLEEYYPDYEFIENANTITEDIYKVALFHEENSEKHIYPFVKHLEQDFKVKTSAHHWVDISDKLAHKGYAIRMLQERLNISFEETMVFGDYNNDIEMLKRGYFSYAMENAHETVKKIARFKTKTNNELGVEYVLQQLICAKNKLKPNGV